MTLDEAIAYLNYIIAYGMYDGTSHDKQAVQLGLEALIAWKRSRKAGGVMQGFKLPGETDGL